MLKPAQARAAGAIAAQAGAPVEWTPKLEGFDTAWNVARGAGALVGVIDTGIDGNHPDLSGKIADAVDQETPPTLANLDTVGHGTHVSSLACAATNNGAG